MKKVYRFIKKLLLDVGLSLTKKSKSRAFSVLEVIVAVSIFALLVASIAGALAFSQDSVAMSSSKPKAIYLAEEGLEAVRNIRDDDYTNLVDGTYGLDLSSGQWEFTGTPDVTDDFLTRQVVISSVETNVKQVEVKVSWLKRSGTELNVTMTTYLTNWRLYTSNDPWVNPVLAGYLDLSGIHDGFKVTTVGDYTYLVRDNGNPDFKILNTLNEAVPTTSSQLNLTGTPQDIKVSGNYAYVATTDNNQELQIISISNPAAPSVVATYNASGNTDAVGLCTAGNYVYVLRSDTTADFIILDVTNPLVPVLRSTLNLTGGGKDCVVIGNYVYVSSFGDTNELISVNVTNPVAPSVVGTLNLSGTFDGLAIDGTGTTVFVGESNGNVASIDITNPAVPVLLGNYSALASVNDISLDTTNKFLFIASSEATKEFQIVNYTNPASMTQVGFFDLSGVLNGVFYYPTKNRAYGVGGADTQEFVILKPL